MCQQAIRNADRQGHSGRGGEGEREAGCCQVLAAVLRRTVQLALLQALSRCLSPQLKFTLASTCPPRHITQIPFSAGTSVAPHGTWAWQTPARQLCWPCAESSWCRCARWSAARCHTVGNEVHPVRTGQQGREHGRSQCKNKAMSELVLAWPSQRVRKQSSSGPASGT